jgi:Zn-dependent protease
MFSLFESVSWDVPLALLLLGLLGFRISLTPRTSLLIKALPEAVFKVIDIFDGKVADHGRTAIRHDLVDAERQIYQHTYTTTIMGGTAKSLSALFRVAERVPGEKLTLVREGLEGKSKSSELLKIEYTIEPEDGGTRFRTAYHWGPRPLLAQVTARSDLWGGSYRLKSMIETGVPNERAYNLISAGVCLVTGLITMATFALIFGWLAAFLIIAILFIHELGHLLAYRLIGQPWGRMLFLPFLGGIALPRLPFETQASAVFAALMGPGFSAFFAVLCAFAFYLTDGTHDLLMRTGFIFVLINLFNLLPVEPLDGGIALRSVLSKILGSFARYGLLAIGLVIIAVGFWSSMIILVIFGCIAVIANLRERQIDQGLTRLTSLQTTIAGFSYIAMTTAYVTLLQYFYSHLQIPADMQVL